MNGDNKKLLAMTILIGLLSACASSRVERDTASNVDSGLSKVKSLVNSDPIDIADAYQNTNQMEKGALLGGGAGAIVGGVSSGIGVVPGAALGAVMGATYGGYIDSFTTLKDRLQNRGGTVTVLGDHLLVVFPSSRIFAEMTPKIKPDAYSTLANLTAYLNQYPAMLVTVSAYTNRSGSSEVDQVLSQQQADSVVKFLTASGLNTRVLYASGRGGDRLVEANELGWGEGLNYRLEITMEKLPV